MKNIKQKIYEYEIWGTQGQGDVLIHKTTNPNECIRTILNLIGSCSLGVKCNGKWIDPRIIDGGIDDN